MAPAPSRSSSASPPSTWIELPRNVTNNILMRLGAEGMLSAQQVCCTWWNVCKDPIMWQVIDLSNPPSRKMNEGYAAMCQRAVDRSQGQLVELTIDSFGHNELINYIVNRSAANLKRLKLVSCIDISPPALTEAVAKLGQLEELHLIMMPSISSHDIVAIGNSCTKLRSFSLNSSKCGLYEDPFRCAEAIATCMPNLHHLQLIANEMRNEVLEAILDGCPCLESLDIRQCWHLHLGGDLGKRCREQIQDLRLPNDSVSDLPWFGRPAQWECDDLFSDEDGFHGDYYCDNYFCANDEDDYDYDYYSDKS
ncbi:putative F-box/LRR-repeat protein 23 [Salvia miltiorrhiza]|uniref:putative F-box/LRR-repeat protein 23 n=1 Tax=Salvia miltiorrhiza TaxID=226208 RepID=UPI0025ACE58E|nr:putative F-box/LRR-repeat protein 23 [Salvia miltiorrhiza]